MKYHLLVPLLLLMIGCNSPEDVDPASRTTFVKVLGSSFNSIGYKTLEISDGYVTVGTAFSDTLEYTTITKTDKFGNTLWTKQFTDTNGLDIIKSDNGYYIVGDSIKRQGNDENLTKIFLLEIDDNGGYLNGTTVGDLSTNPKDYHGVALAKNDTDEIVILGSLEDQFDQENMIVVGFNTSLETQWEQIFSLSNENYMVGSNLYYDNTGRIIWVASSILYNSEDNSVIEKSSISIPVILSNSENINNDTYGDTMDGIYLANNINQVLGGYGIVGTTDINGTNDIFYIKSNSLGDFDANSFTAISTTMNGIILSGNDKGLAIVGTSDGGSVIMGSMTTTTQIGNGGTDIYLLKLDFSGNPIWESIIGGSGNETGNAIIQTRDGGFLITGSNDFQGSAVTLLIKTNHQGKLIE